jgi:hypothetical protein
MSRAMIRESLHRETQIRTTCGDSLDVGSRWRDRRRLRSSIMLTIRDASAGDAAACAAMYAPYVLDTVISFETVPPDAAEMAGRMAAAHVWLMGDDDGRRVGFAYGGTFNPREAYRWACSVSVYLEVGRRRTGAGRARGMTSPGCSGTSE